MTGYHAVTFSGNIKRESDDVYAGGRLDEKLYGKTNGTITLERTLLKPQERADLCGHTLTSDTSTGNVTVAAKEGDPCVFVRYFVIAPEMADGKKGWMVSLYYKVQFDDPDDDFETGGKGTPVHKNAKLSGTVLANCDGNVRDQVWCKTYEAATAVATAFLAGTAQQ